MLTIYLEHKSASLVTMCLGVASKKTNWASWQICRTDLLSSCLWRPRSKFLQLIRNFVAKLYLSKGFWLRQNKITSSSVFEMTKEQIYTSVWQIYHNTVENFDIIIKSSYKNAKIKVSLSLHLARYLTMKLHIVFLKINQK